MPREVPIQICGHTWRIRFARPRTGDAGLCVYRTHRIWIDPSQTEPELLDTLLHELQHAVEHEDSERRAGIWAATVQAALTACGYEMTADIGGFRSRSHG